MVKADMSVSWIGTKGYCHGKKMNKNAAVIESKVLTRNFHASGRDRACFVEAEYVHPCKRFNAVELLHEHLVSCKPHDRNRHDR